MKKITQEKIKSVLEYNPETGVFIWINSHRNHRHKIGIRAGSILKGRNGRRYEKIGIEYKIYSSHRLAWMYMFGTQPEEIDHVNGDSLDNRILNLRAVTHCQNLRNHGRKIRKNGLPAGVSTSGRFFRARITAFRKMHYLGTFRSVEDASEAYEKARDKMHDAPCRGKHHA